MMSSDRTKILSALGKAYDLDGLTYACTASIGVTLFGQTDESTETVVNRADEAMYEAKSAGRNSIRFALV
jgi:diguanylate cyclase (GGDEF)-like protein